MNNKLTNTGFKVGDFVQSKGYIGDSFIIDKLKRIRMGDAGRIDGISGENLDIYWLSGELKYKNLLVHRSGVRKISENEAEVEAI